MTIIKKSNIRGKVLNFDDIMMSVILNCNVKNYDNSDEFEQKR